METLRVENLSLGGSRNRLFEKASSLIGSEDAQHWYNRHKTLFEHPMFINRTVYQHGNHLQNTMKALVLSNDCIWAHTHWNWSQFFGVYFVRRGTEIIYEGRSEDEVKRFLGIKSNL